MEPIKTRVYVENKLSFDSYMEKETALHSNRIPLTEIQDLEFHSIEEGREIPESGKVEKKYCCVERREVIKENGEQVVKIYGYWC